MNTKILIIILLVSDIAFASSVQIELLKPRKAEVENIQREDISTLADAISEHLFANGLDKDVAQKKVSHTLTGDTQLHALMLNNVLNSFNTVSHENVISYIAKNALIEREVDLSKYDHLLALLQATHCVALDDNSLEKIKSITLENQRLIRA